MSDALPGEAKACRSCGQEIIWTKTSAGKAMPVDAERVEGGNLLIRMHRGPGQPGTAVYLGPAELKKCRAEHEAKVKAGIEQPGPLRLFKSHFATCPDRGTWRKGRRGARTVRLKEAP